MWFDVGKGKKTTLKEGVLINLQLWFDVGKGKKTTPGQRGGNRMQLWFDVGKGKKTTHLILTDINLCCGLM